MNCLNMFKLSMVFNEHVQNRLLAFPVNFTPSFYFPVLYSNPASVSSAASPTSCAIFTVKP